MNKAAFGTGLSFKLTFLALKLELFSVRNRRLVSNAYLAVESLSNYLRSV